MTRRELLIAVARATGEDLREIRRRGFSLADPDYVDFDPEPDQLPPQIIDWDDVEHRHQSSVFEQVFGPYQPAI
ncbi:MAG: hypothetical protein KDA90_09225 [Planctomycetaceae bacterium]|nr:hypothetical protein [Planctomycetaceae bacterium]